MARELTNKNSEGLFAIFVTGYVSAKLAECRILGDYHDAEDPVGYEAAHRHEQSAEIFLIHL
jgi:hypothetical protein